MEDYPRTLQELESLFASEEACRDYLARLRWPHGFVCPTCEGTQEWCTGRGLWMCGSCGHQTSVTAGTLFQDTRTSLVTWFRAVWWVVSQKNGARIPPRPAPVGNRGPSPSGRNTASSEFPESCSVPLPLPPQDRPQPAVQPLIQSLEAASNLPACATRPAYPILESCRLSQPSGCRLLGHMVCLHASGTTRQSDD